MNKVQQGFTLVEVIIALSIGLVIFAGILSVFVGMKSTSTETSNYGELQENGRFAISLLSDDLLKQNFFGDFGGTFGGSNLITIPGAAGNDCVGGGINNATFPLVAGQFRTLWGQTITAADPMGCFNDARISANANFRSDLIQIKRVVGTPLVAAAVGFHYLTTNITTGSLYAGGGAIPLIDNSRTWQYQHHVYYVREEAQGDEVVPVLMQGRLVGGNMTFAPIIDGIETIRFMYGVDRNGDGGVNAFISADNMTAGLWNNAGGSRVLAVKIFVLARSTLPDYKYSNEATYQLGDLAVTVNDNYRRLLFTSTVTLYNASVDQW
ncbi:MAG: PilW family protein [Colwellia sp.]|nr:PilW family protein [Colwellia sp.]